MKFFFLLSFIFIYSSVFAQSPSKILILGDSLTEGYGVAKNEAFPYQLEILLNNKSQKTVKVINGGSSGATSASSYNRLKWYLKAKPKILILALGANDGLRGLSPKNTEKNLEKAIQLAKKTNVKVILAGMKAPPNYGKDYTTKFFKIFITLKIKHKLKFIPFLLEGVAGEPKLNLPDGIHPNPDGHKKIAQLLFKHLKGL